MNQRARTSGILLHVTSLPGPHGIGDLGVAAHRFIDFLARAGQQVWQVLPLGPVDTGGSPYSSLSAFAGNPWLISLERLREEGLLAADDLDGEPFDEERVDYERVRTFKERALERAFERFAQAQDAHSDLHAAFEAFCADNAAWLDDYALFMALKEAHGGRAWTDWDPALVRRAPGALAAARETHAQAVERRRFWQFLFYRQWSALRAHCRARGIRLFGDVPIYVAHDSADVWANQELFHLDEGGQPTVVSGVPPDMFSETGQRWGQPIYRWQEQRERVFAWWKRRFRAVLRQVDLVRVDHFRGFAAYWEIPASEPTAEGGTWKDGPGKPFFEAIREDLGRLPVVAEDLGVITEDVEALRDDLGLGGMAVLPFGLQDGPSSTHMPHHWPRAATAYTGTHDNDTIVGWWNALPEQEGGAEARDLTRRYLGLGEGEPVHWPCIRAVMTSVARRAVVPMQDALGLGRAARMNTPGETEDNWAWRVRAEALTGAVADRLRALAALSDRLPEALPVDADADASVERWYEAAQSAVGQP